MNIKNQLLKAHSRENAQRIVEFIGNDAQKFTILMEHFFDTEYRISQRAAQTVSHCIDKNSELIIPYIGQLISNLENNPEVAIKRNTVRILQNQEIPEEYQGILVEKCFEYLLSSNEAIAVKVFAMTILSNMVKIYPELQNELFLAINDQIEFGSPGFVSRGKKILKDLKK